MFFIPHPRCVLCIEILTLLRGKIWLFKGRPFIQVEDRGESVTGRVQKGYGSSAGQVQNGCKREAERVQRKTSIYDPGAALTSPEARSVFIGDALATGHAAHVAASIGVAISAFGATEMARRTGIAVEDLEQLFGIHGDPDLYRLMKVLHVLGVSLSVTARTQ